MPRLITTLRHPVVNAVGAAYIAALVAEIGAGVVPPCDFAAVFLPMRIGKPLNQAVHRIIRHGKDDNRPLTRITLNV